MSREYIAFQLGSGFYPADTPHTPVLSRRQSGFQLGSGFYPADTREGAEKGNTRVPSFNWAAGFTPLIPMRYAIWRPTDSGVSIGQRVLPR